MAKKKYKPYKQGIYRPQHPEKYNGTLPICYRSGLELTCMQWFDRNANVISWASESTVIPYVSPKDGRVHRYFVDFNFTINRNGNIKKYLVEVKPSRQTKPPRKTKNTKSYLYESAQYAVNSAKWAEARKWAKKHGAEFVIFTEKHLKK